MPGHNIISKVWFLHLVKIKLTSVAFRHHNPGNQHVDGLGRAEQDSGWRESAGDQDSEGGVHPDKPGQDIRCENHAKDVGVVHGCVGDIILDDYGRPKQSSRCDAAY